MDIKKDTKVCRGPEGQNTVTFKMRESLGTTLDSDWAELNGVKSIPVCIACNFKSGKTFVF